jgi:V/A-type H+/Na+-transporting ATPase subunit A
MEGQQKTGGMLKRIAGPVVTAVGLDAHMYDVVKVGTEELMGEVIKIDGEAIIIQVYEDTTGLRPGEPVSNTGLSLAVDLGPGLLTSIYDGIQRPLEVLVDKMGSFIERGVSAPGIPRDTKWEFKPLAKAGDEVVPGSIIGEVQETNIVHRIMVPPNVKGGKIKSIQGGSYTVEETIATLEDGTELQMMHRWPVRVPRPVRAADHGSADPRRPLPDRQGRHGRHPRAVRLGQDRHAAPAREVVRRRDRGLHRLRRARQRDDRGADRVPRAQGPEVGQAAHGADGPDRQHLEHARRGPRGLGLHRDHDRRVLPRHGLRRLADGRLDLALGRGHARDLGRLEEMPGEEGYPAYLAARLAEFYERSGLVTTLNGDTGSVSVIGAVSPPGGDFSEPVTQNTLRIVKVFWALDAKLSQRRHFPSINWLNSYSLYLDSLGDWYDREVSPEWNILRGWAMEVLQKEAELQEIVQLVGSDALPETEQITIEVARLIREVFLQQNAYDPVDTFCSMGKQYDMMKAIRSYADQAYAAQVAGVPPTQIITIKAKNDLPQIKFAKDYESMLDGIMKAMETEFTQLRSSA